MDLLTRIPDITIYPLSPTHSSTTQFDTLPPTTFSCLNCDRTLGDSSTLLFQVRAQSTLTFSHLACVLICDNEPTLASSEGSFDEFSFYKLIKCAKCLTVIGKKYLSTPSKLNPLQQNLTIEYAKLSVHVHGQLDPAAPIAVSDKPDLVKLVYPDVTEITQRQRELMQMVVMIKEDLDEIQEGLREEMHTSVKTIQGKILETQQKLGREMAVCPVMVAPQIVEPVQTASTTPKISVNSQNSQFTVNPSLSTKTRKHPSSKPHPNPSHKIPAKPLPQSKQQSKNPPTSTSTSKSIIQSSNPSSPGESASSSSSSGSCNENVEGQVGESEGENVKKRKIGVGRTSKVPTTVSAGVLESIGTLSGTKRKLFISASTNPAPKTPVKTEKSNGKYLRRNRA